MASSKRRPGPIWRFIETVLAYKLAHIIYFVGSFAMFYAGTILVLALNARAPFRVGRVAFSGYLYGLVLSSPWFHMLALCVAVLCGLFGPYVYRAHTMRGRGQLAKIRAASVPKVRNRVIWHHPTDESAPKETEKE